MLIDSHVHLQDKKFARDFDRVIQRAEDSGVEYYVCVGDRVESSRRAIALAKQHPRITAAIGIHPHHDMLFTRTAMMELEMLSRDPHVAAIGEIGLDYHYPGYNAERQAACFLSQGHLAGRRNLPLIIHCRDAYDELLALLESDPRIPRRGVVHCYSGNVEQARAFVRMGYHLGIGGALTYPNGDMLRDVVRTLGIERLLVETDAPYLPPQAKRGRRNEPSYMKHTVKSIAELTGYSYQDVARVTRTNALGLFCLPETLAPTAAYSVRQNLHLCLTNRCPNECYYCQRCSDYLVLGHYVRLDHEPELDELLERVGNAAQWHEVVLSGPGEPTLRWELALNLARELKARGARVRLHTSGLGNLINGRDITPEMAGLFDAVTIHLAAHDQETYNRIARPESPDLAYPAMLEFAEACKRVVPEITMAIVALPEVDVEACRVIAEDKLQVRLRVRDARPDTLNLATC